MNTCYNNNLHLLTRKILITCRNFTFPETLLCFLTRPTITSYLVMSGTFITILVIKYLSTFSVQLSVTTTVLMIVF